MIQLLKYLKEYKKDAVMTPVWVLLETVGELFLTITIGHFIDEIANPNTAMDIILSYGLRLFFLAVACLIFGGISGWTSTKAAAGLSKNLRNEMFSRIQDFSFTNIDKFSTNSLVTRMTTDVMNVQNAVMIILMSLMMLSMVYVMIMMSRESVSRIREILKEQSGIVNPENPDKEIRNGEIVFDHVGFSYIGDPDRLCLSDIDLHIRSGETIGIIGGTGSGKSSLVQLVPRLYDATVGTVIVGGKNVKEYDLESLRDAVAMVLQKNVLFAGSISAIPLCRSLSTTIS